MKANPRAQFFLLLWLRVRTMFRGRHGAAQVIVFGFIMLFGAVMSLSVAAGVGMMTSHLAARSSPKLVTEWTHLILFAAWFALGILPVLGFGSSEFYDITKLFHFPVSHRTVLLAQLLGIFFGPTCLFFLAPLIALAVSLPGGVAASVLHVVVVVALLFQAVAVGQVLQLSMLNLLRSRWFRETIAVVAAVATGSIYLLSRYLFENGTQQGMLTSFLQKGLSRYLVFVPSHWASSAIVPGGGAASILVFAFVFLPVTVLFVLLAAHLQERAFHGLMPEAKSKKKHEPRRGLKGTPFPFSLVPGEVRSVAATELTLLRREPTVKMMLIQQLAFFIIPLGFFIFQGDPAERGGFFGVAGTMAAVVYVLLYIELQISSNLFGLDGPSVKHLFAMPVSHVRILAGKTLAYFGLWGSLNVVALVACAFVLSGVGRRPDAAEVVVEFVEAFSALLVLLGLGAVVSVILPFTFCRRGRSALSQGQEQQGCLRSVLRLACFFGFLVVAAPVALFCHVPGPSLFSVGALLYGLAVYLVGIQLAGNLLDRRRDRLIASLTLS